MKYLFLATLLSATISVFAQHAPAVPALPNTKEEFIASEKDFISIAKWLETTAVDKSDERMKLHAWVIAWITNSPTVTVNVRSSILKAVDKNPALMVVYMAGYSRYVLENSYSKDELKANAAGIKSAINCYKLGGDIKKDKNIQKVIEQDDQGKLEEWVAEAMKEK